MSFEMIAWIGGIAVTMLFGLATIVWYFISQLNKHVDERLDTARIEADKRVDLIKTIADEAKQEAKKVREEMYEEFVRHSHYDKTSDAIFRNMANVDDKLSSVAKDVNQLIGKVEALDINATKS